MSDAQDIALPPTDGLDLTEENVVDPIAAPDGAEPPVSIPAPDEAASPAEGSPAPGGVNSTAEGDGTKTNEKPWWNIFPGGKRKTKKQSRKQKGGKKSKSRGGNKKSRKQKRSAKNKRA
jgi:hypothetical protein